MRFDYSQGNLVEAFVRQRKSKSGWFDEIERLVVWDDLVGLFDHVYASTEGGACYLIETYIKLLLLQQWYGLSDEGLEAAVDDRLSFRRFSGIPLDRPVPDHSSIWRFRQHLIKKDKAGVSLGEWLLTAINEQLDGKGGVGEVSPVDPDAGFTKKNGKTFFGYKAHAGVDEGSGLIRQAIMATASLWSRATRTPSVPTRPMTTMRAERACKPPASRRTFSTRRGATSRFVPGKRRSTRSSRRSGHRSSGRSRR